MAAKSYTIAFWVFRSWADVVYAVTVLVMSCMIARGKLRSPLVGGAKGRSFADVTLQRSAVVCNVAGRVSCRGMSAGTCPVKLTELTTLYEIFRTIGARSVDDIRTTDERCGLLPPLARVLSWRGRRLLRLFWLLFGIG